jgi:hypothetical protein
MGKILKEILDEFGWDRIQEGQMPFLETEPNRNGSETRVHNYDLYALRGVYALVEDNKTIFDISGIRKNSCGYKRTARLPQDSAVKIQNAAQFLEGFKHICQVHSRFRYDQTENMHFDGVCKRMESAEELYYAQLVSAV